MTKTVFSAIQPSGTVHIGNYLGAIKNWINLQNDNETFFCIVDQHAITVPYEPDKMPEKIIDAFAAYLTCGLNPEKNTIFVQSHVPAHTELAWLLGTITPYGELTRMTQFKDKSAKHQQDTTLGLFAYPVLMAADILLYQTTTVPVGEDQLQHIELARSIAHRFNNRFGEIFTVPKAQVNKNTQRIMSLTDPAKKMSKSDSTKSYIALTDQPEDIKKKVMSAVTETEFNINSQSPAIKNLITIYQSFGEENTGTIAKKFSGQGYKEFKESLAELLINKLAPIREKYKELRQDDDQLRLMLAKGAQKATETANQTLAQVKQIMGLV